MNHSPETRLTLIEKIRNPADVQAWGEFIEIYEPLIIETCRRKGLQHADAIDVAQDVLARVAGSVERFCHDAAGATFRGWLYRITRNLTIDLLRRRSRDALAQGEVPIDLGRIPEPSTEESAEFDLAYQRQMFLLVARRVESKVKPQTWAAFWKVEVEQLDPTVVASELGMSRGAVYVAKSRVLARLRREVQKRLESTGSFATTPEEEGQST